MNDVISLCISGLLELISLKLVISVCFILLSVMFPQLTVRIIAANYLSNYAAAYILYNYLK